MGSGISGRKAVRVESTLSNPSCLDSANGVDLPSKSRTELID